MSVKYVAYGNMGNVYSFLDNDVPESQYNFITRPIDVNSTSLQITSTFILDGQLIKLTLGGNFPNSPSSLGTLAALSASNINYFGATLDGTLIFDRNFTPSISLEDAIAIDYAFDENALERVYSGDDIFIGSIETSSSGDNDWVNGYAGNDTFYGNAGAPGQNSDGFYGNDGIDTAVFRGNRSEYTVQNWEGSLRQNAVGQLMNVADSQSTRDGSKMLQSVERLQFADKKIAFDLTADGHAGQAMAFIGVIAPSLLNDLPVRGVILSLFDQGQTMESLSQLALDLDLVPKANNSELVKTIYQNVIGADPSQDMTNDLVGYIESHSQANFLATVAGFHFNVDLVGLQQMGIEFV